MRPARPASRLEDDDVKASAVVAEFDRGGVVGDYLGVRALRADDEVAEQDGGLGDPWPVAAVDLRHDHMRRDAEPGEAVHAFFWVGDVAAADVEGVAAVDGAVAEDVGIGGWVGGRRRIRRRGGGNFAELGLVHLITGDRVLLYPVPRQRVLL